MTKDKIQRTKDKGKTQRKTEKTKEKGKSKLFVNNLLGYRLLQDTTSRLIKQTNDYRLNSLM